MIMDLLIAFGVFLATLVGCLAAGLPSLIALAVGLACFIGVGVHRGFRLPDLLRMAYRGAAKSKGVLLVFVLIGLITGLWRAGGVIAYFVKLGLEVITPKSFIMVTFLLSCLLGYALGSSFGVTGTVGVVMIAIARTGGVNPLIVAGAVMSASYFGERIAPTSSCLHLVSMVTKTDVMGNVRENARTLVLPAALTLLIYGILSAQNPLSAQSGGFAEEISGQFALSHWLILPAVLMILLPLFRVDVMYAMLASAAVSFALTVVLQDMSVGAALKVCFVGFEPAGGQMAHVFAGGGIGSMVSVSGLVILSSSYSGVFEGTRMLDDVQVQIARLEEKIGLLPTGLLTGLAACTVFCSQTIAIILGHQLVAPVYEKRGAQGRELMSDISNTSVTLAALVPWCAACAVPMEMMNVGVGCLPYGVYLYLTPLCWLAVKRFYYKRPKAAAA